MKVQFSQKIIFYIYNNICYLKGATSVNQNQRRRRGGGGGGGGRLLLQHLSTVYDFK
jgi:hypothetical protein